MYIYRHIQTYIPQLRAKPPASPQSSMPHNAFPVARNWSLTVWNGRGCYVQTIPSLWTAERAPHEWLPAVSAWEAAWEDTTGLTSITCSCHLKSDTETPTSLYSKSAKQKITNHLYHSLHYKNEQIFTHNFMRSKKIIIHVNNDSALPLKIISNNK